MKKDYTLNQKQYQAPEMQVIKMENNVQLLAGTQTGGEGEVPGLDDVRGSAIDFGEEE